MVRLLEVEVPKLVSEFALVVRSDDEMGDAEAYTEFNPAHIAVRGSVYQLALRNDGRSRMTLAHELGHLVMHPGAAKLRSTSTLSEGHLKYFESAEWQAKKFAALFLVPDHIALQFSNAEQLAASCHVSLQAAQIRFNETTPLRKSRPLPTVILETLDELKKKE
ncbi:ImmA/IrrE family metallo-endopeptidase [Bradyrhizobium centrosematis]|uniref:ImmA/IrrE family metallo-endopeptidase n=1 Tax=Bradyrhizobium centrosematis TaxID=1300039 RepID=UPI002168919F|nr:ImmA/IrrE family metallo-endopeptidase [Bradyrhizobium centrosematis]MCS3759337.1 Zn-dependent peptidase ImmA (M78 family) [Bradyrhizobium centrosematis]MCS3772773.1 Zn-dependent peptidase ImmA (M78 family) [Bradyrhizobium centrosematis]